MSADKILFDMLTDEKIEAWADGVVRKQAFNRSVAVEIAIAAAKWVRETLVASPVERQTSRLVQADECAHDVYEFGQSIGLFDIPKATANSICAGISEVTGARVDWHYIAGRVHIKALAAASAAPDSAPAPTCDRTALIAEMVNRFLSWKFPLDFAPDAGITFEPPANHAWWPTGTNLLTAYQAVQMIDHILPAPAEHFMGASARKQFDELMGENAELREMLAAQADNRERLTLCASEQCDLRTAVDAAENLKLFDVVRAERLREVIFAAHPGQPEPPTFEAKHLSLKQKGAKVILTLELDGVEGAPRYAVTPINPSVVRPKPESRAEVTDAARRAQRHWNPVYNTDPVQRACAELPEGWELQVCLESGAGWIDLYDAAGEKFEAEFGDDHFDWQIHTAIDIAIDAARAGAAR